MDAEVLKSSASVRGSITSSAGPRPPAFVSSKLKMGGSSKMELTHLVMVASSAGTLRRCVKHIAEGG